MQKRVPLKLPIANIFHVAARSLAVTAIGGYQKFISPHKGFSCAHRVLYGCESCSQYFKQVIAEEGIFTAIANAKGRFQECREANEILKARRAKCRARRKYSASRLISSTLAIESGDLESPDLPEDLENPEETETPNKNRLGGSLWGRRRRSQAKNDNDDSNGGVNNNCNNCDSCSDGVIDIPCDCLSDSLGDCNNPLEGVNCPDLSCPDLNCGNADCLSGMDCSGLDCGDCGNVGDCGDCGSCG